MNILYLALDTDISSGAGDAIHVKEVVKALGALGHNVELIAWQSKSGWEDIAELGSQDNIRVHFLFQEQKRGNRATVSYCKGIARAAKAEVIYERRFSGKVGYSLGKLLKTPYFIEINGLVDAEARMQGRKGEGKSASQKIKKRMRGTFFKNAYRVIAVTGGIKNTLVREYGLDPERIVVVPNGANTDIFNKMDRMECRKSLGLEPGWKYICFSGNLAPWQGVKYLISAMPSILKKEKNARLLIVGDGMLGDELKKKAKDAGVADAVLFVGRVPYTDVPKYICASDACVAPFTYERNAAIGLSPLKLYEYLACGRPVVSTDIEGVKELLEKTEAGIIVPSENSEELAKAVTRLIQDTETGDTMGVRGREYVLENHSWLGVGKKIASLCEKALGPGRT